MLGEEALGFSFPFLICSSLPFYHIIFFLQIAFPALFTWQKGAFHSLPFTSSAGGENLMNKIQLAIDKEYADKTGMASQRSENHLELVRYP